MRKYLLAGAAVAAIASPAMARDGAGYVGIEGGIIAPRDSNYDLSGSTTRTRVTTGTPPVTTTTVNSVTYNNGFVTDYKKGVDLDAIAGYDFGMFRLEGELGYKRTKAKNFTASPAVLTDLSTALGAPVTNADLDGSDRTTVLSGMVNALVDLSVAPGVSLYAGGGAGYARVKTLGLKDEAFAWQLIAGVSTAISPNVDLGLKYRYFNTAKLKYGTNYTDAFTDAGGTTTINSVFAADSKFRSHSLLASLIFNFGGAEAAPPPPPPVEVAPPPPPPPAPPATQTCPDGSVIDAMATCPLPPPPPPPAPPAQGERG